MSKLAPSPIDCVNKAPLASVRAPRARLKRFAWNLEVVREQVPEGFDIREAELCLSADNQSYIAAKLGTKNPLRLHAIIRSLMQAQRIDKGAAGLYDDHVLYDDRGRAVVLGNREGAMRVPDPKELRPGLDIRTIYATGTPPLDEEPVENCSRRKTSFLGYALIGAVTTTAGVATWLWLRGRKNQPELEEEETEEVVLELEEDEETATQDD